MNRPPMAAGKPWPSRLVPAGALLLSASGARTGLFWVVPLVYFWGSFGQMSDSFRPKDRNTFFHCFPPSRRFSSHSFHIVLCRRTRCDPSILAMNAFARHFPHFRRRAEQGDAEESFASSAQSGHPPVDDWCQLLCFLQWLMAWISDLRRSPCALPIRIGADAVSCGASIEVYGRASPCSHAIRATARPRVPSRSKADGHHRSRANNPREGNPHSAYSCSGS